MTSFKLINFLDDSNFNYLREKMGAKLAPANQIRLLKLLDEDQVRRLGREGIEIDDFSEVKTEPDNTLSYKGKRVTVYIRDVAEYKERQNLPRYHIAFCWTLDKMTQNKRWHRYVVANRDDGKFTLNYVGDNSRTEIENLDVCQNCLDLLRWEEFKSNLSRSQKIAIVKNFRLADFFTKYPKDLHTVLPTHTSDTAPINDYTDDWDEIAKSYKRKTGYQCQKCSLRLKDDSFYLHVHHIDGQKNNNSISNLQALCMSCHADEPMHQHMKSGPIYEKFMSTYGKHFSNT